MKNHVIGMVDDVLYVVVTYREEDVVRIISARLATKAERRRYERGGTLAVRHKAGGFFMSETGRVEWPIYWRSVIEGSFVAESANK